MSTELPGERSARIVREMREQDAKDEEAAREALHRFCVLGGATDGFPAAEEAAYVIGYKDRIRDQRRLGVHLAVYDLGYDGITVLGVSATQEGAKAMCEEHHAKQSGHWPHKQPLAWRVPSVLEGEVAEDLVADLGPTICYYTEKWTVDASA